MPIIIYKGGERFKVYSRYRIDFPDIESFESARDEFRDFRKGPLPSPYVKTTLPRTRSIIVETYAWGSEEVVQKVIQKNRGRVVWTRGFECRLSSF